MYLHLFKSFYIYLLCTCTQMMCINKQLKMILHRYKFVMKSGILFACIQIMTHTILYLCSVLKYMKQVLVLY